MTPAAPQRKDPESKNDMPRFGTAHNNNAPQDRFNLEMFRALELLGHKLERVEKERDQLARRLEQIESASSIDAATGRLYLPAVVEPQAPQSGLERHAVRWSVGAAFSSSILALCALGLVIFHTPQTNLTTAQLAALNTLGTLQLALLNNKSPATIPVTTPAEKLAALQPAAGAPALTKALVQKALGQTGALSQATMPPQPVAAVTVQTIKDPAKDASLPASLQPLEQKALEGLPEAQHDLGTVYAAGTLVPQNYARAAAWFHRAADVGIANAAYNLGVMYQQGLGVPKDDKAAIDWYDKAAQKGHPEALYNLGIVYTKGLGAAVDMDKGVAYFKRAANAGVAQAAYNLGVLYEGKLLGKPAPERALDWYGVAANQGHAAAKAALIRLQGQYPDTAKKMAQDEAAAAPSDSVAQKLSTTVEPAAGGDEKPVATIPAATGSAFDTLTQGERKISVPSIAPVNR